MPTLMLVITSVITIALLSSVIITIISSFIIAITTSVSSMMLAVIRNIMIVVPSLINEIDWTSARMIFATVLTPMLSVFVWNDEIDWASNDTNRCTLNQNWLRLYQHRARSTTDIDLPIKSWLPNANRNTNISCKGWNRNNSQSQGCNQTSHAYVL